MLNMRYRQWMANILVAVIGVVLFITLFAQLTFRVEAFQFSLNLEMFPHGVTEIRIPPVGTISAATHIPPIKIRATLENIDLELLQSLLQRTPQQQQLLQQIQQQLLAVVRAFVLRLLFLSAAGGVVGIVILRRRGLRPYLQGALTGIVLMGVLLGTIYYTYDISRFRNPQYQGIIKAAPWMIGLAEKALATVDDLGEQLELTAANLYRLFERVDELQPVGGLGGTLKVLQVSDIHNNPAAFDLIQQIVRSFQVDMVVDTGDISDYGTPLEGQLVARIGELQIPYLFVPGNHDSPAIIKAMEAIDNVILLTKPVELYGLKLLGVADPFAGGPQITALDPRGAAVLANSIREDLQQLKPFPDVLAVHNHRVARDLAGTVEVILFGHDHHARLEESKGSILVDAGTSGAAGIRGLIAANEVPYTVVLLHWRWGPEKWKMVAADTIRVFNLTSGFTLERQTFNTDTFKTSNQQQE